MEFSEAWKYRWRAHSGKGYAFNFFLVIFLSCIASAAYSQNCIEAEQSSLSGDALEARRVSAITILGKDIYPIEEKHCLPLIPTAIGPPENPAWLTISTFYFEPYDMTVSEFLIDVVDCRGYQMSYECEASTQTHYYLGDLSFSVRLTDGIDAVLASRILDAIMEAQSAPNLPCSGDDRASYHARLRVSEGEVQGQYHVGNDNCYTILTESADEIAVTGHGTVIH